MTNIIIDKNAAQKIVEAGSGSSQVHKYSTPTSVRPKHAPSIKAIERISYKDLIREVYIASGGYIQNSGITVRSKDAWTKDEETGLYKAKGYLIDIGLFKTQRASYTDDLIDVYSSISVDVTSDFSARTDKYLHINLLVSGYFFVIWMFDRWNLLAPATWRNEEKI